MNKIEINDWEVKLPNGQTHKENLLGAINVIVGQLSPEKIPRGIEAYQIFGKIATAFDKAAESKTLELEDREYAFLVDTIKENIPSVWAFNKNLKESVDKFLAISPTKSVDGKKSTL